MSDAMVMEAKGAVVDTRPLRGAFSLRDGLIQAFYNRRIVLICLGVGAAAGLVAAIAAPNRYEADALLLIRPGVAEQAQTPLNGPTQILPADAVQRMVQSDIQILLSDPVVRAAAAKAGPGALRGEATPAVADKFRKTLHVTSEPNTNVIRVSWTGRNRDRAIRSVQGVVDAYLARRAAMYVDGQAGRQTETLSRYDTQLKAVDNHIQQVRANYGVVDISQDVQLASARQDSLAQRISQARERLSAVEAELAAGQQSLGQTPARVFDSAETSNATPNDDARNTLLRLRQERQHMAAQYAADWPGLAEVDQKITAAEQQVQANAGARSSNDREVRNPVADQLASRVAALQLERQALGRQLTELGAQQKTALDRLDALRVADDELHGLSRDRDLTETIVKQLAVQHAAGQLGDAAQDDPGSNVRVIQPPGAPAKGHSLRLTLFLAGILAGIGSAIAASGIATLLRQVFITPGEAERALALPGIAALDLAGGGIDRASIDRLAVQIIDTRIDDGPLKIAQLIGDGAGLKSALGLEVAKALARDHNQLTLIVDIDGQERYRLMAPAEADRRGVPLPAGRLVVAKSSDPKLWVATDISNTPLGDPRALGADVRGCLDVLRKSFDRVVLIGGRDFSHYGARRLYPLADANILVVDAGKTREPIARRMRDVVLGAGGDLLGFVFTSRQYYVPKAIYRWL
jgi:uncharacterized protein involved in exopolysaccharide biosynthesis